MVKQSLREIDPRKIKLAKQVLAVFEVMGITEENLTSLSEIEDFKDSVFEGLSKNIASLREEIGSLDEEIGSFRAEIDSLREENGELRGRIDSIIRAQKNEASGGTASRKSLSEIIKENYDGKVEEFRPYGK